MCIEHYDLHSRGAARGSKASSALLQMPSSSQRMAQWCSLPECFGHGCPAYWISKGAPAAPPRPQASVMASRSADTASSVEVVWSPTATTFEGHEASNGAGGGAAKAAVWQPKRREQGKVSRRLRT